MTYAPRQPLLPHQLEGARRRAARPPGEDVWADFSEMGTGKTASLLAEWGERAAAGDLTDLLVVAPRGSYRSWWSSRGEGEVRVVCELDKHLDPALRERTLVAPWVSGMGVTARRALGDFLAARDRPRAFFINVEALGTVAKAQLAADEFMAAGRTLMVVDESTRIRTHDAKRTDWVVRHGKAARARRIMTGLPTPRSPLDLFSQFEFLDWRILGFRDFFPFRRRYAVMEQAVVGVQTGADGEVRRDAEGKPRLRYAWVDLDYRNLDELRERAAPWQYRALKADCLRLPPKVYLRREVELTDEQRRVYEELRTEATAELDSGEFVSADRRVQQVLRLHQVVLGHVTTEAREVRALKSNRVRTLMEVLEEHSGKVAVWFHYKPGLHAVAAALRAEYGPAAVAEFHGDNAGTRDVDELRWRTDAGCPYVCATEDSGGLGNNWQCSSLAVYFSNSYDLEHRMQSEDRHHRMGQGAERVTYVDLVSPGTVDERILEVLRKKMTLAAALMGDGYREWLRPVG